MEQGSSITNLDKATVVALPTFPEGSRGTLTVVESMESIPFQIARIFYIYGTPKGGIRGAHAHRHLQQAFIAVSGSLSIELADGRDTRRFVLATPDRALYVPPMLWTTLRGFSGTTVCLVLASAKYDPTDYILKWDEYRSIVNASDSG